MRTKLKDVRAWLKSEGLKFDYDKKEKVVMIITGDGESTQLHRINLDKSSNMLQWHMHAVDESTEKRKKLNLKDNLYKDMILEYILFINYQYKIGSWEYDYHDGDVRFYMGLPLDNTKMTKEQFDRVKEVMFRYGNEGAKGISYISEHGRFPEEITDTDVDILRSLLQRLSEMKENEVIDTDVVDKKIKD